MFTELIDNGRSDVVIPANAGIQWLVFERRWVPAFAGTTRIFAK